MPKTTGTIHYLKTPPPKEADTPAPSPSPFEDMIRRLETRIEKIEKEFRGGSEELLKTEFDSLMIKLEERIRRLSKEEPRPKLPVPPSPPMLERIRKIAEAFWSAAPGENYEVDEFGMDPAFSKRVKPFFDFLYYKYWRVSVKGIQNIPSQGRGLIVANHSGTLPYDGAMIRVATENDHPSRRDVRFLVEDFVYHFPFLGTFMYRIGGVRACPENAERLLSKNHLVAVFPEGIKGIGKHYKNRYRLQRFGRGGFIKLALKSQSPIIPCAVIGAEEIHPLIYKSTVLARPLGIPYIPITPTLPLLGVFGLIPLPSKWTIVFGEPIRFTKYGPEHAEDQLLVNRLSEMVREKIQEMIVEELKHRRSVWFG